ncbi:hypothetical protein KIPB_013952, partial [Kipferlia bialata]
SQFSCHRSALVRALVSLGVFHEKKNTMFVIEGGKAFFFKTLGENVTNDGEYLESYLHSGFEELRSHGAIIGGCSTDNAANILKGVRLVSQNEGCEAVEQIPCACHTVQLSVTDLKDATHPVFTEAKRSIDALGPWCKENKAKILQNQRDFYRKRKAGNDIVQAILFLRCNYGKLP